MKGKIIRWIDNKGFGFIKPESGKSDVFLHISDLDRVGNTKPRVGDLVSYDIETDAKGKSRAVNATIEEISSKKSSTQANERGGSDEQDGAKSSKSYKLISALIALILGVVINVFQGNEIDLELSPASKPAEQISPKGSSSQQLLQLFENQKSDVQVQGSGIVIRTLPDDLEGSQHQKFILKVSSKLKLLIAHNIDLAPRINSLREGDVVEFYGEYEWNSMGGVLHWTHKDPRGNHIGGWLKHKGSTYQ